MADAAIGRHLIGAGDRPERPRHHAGAVGADIGPLVVEEFIVDAENASVGIDGHAREMPLLP